MFAVSSWTCSVQPSSSEVFADSQTPIYIYSLVGVSTIYYEALGLGGGMLILLSLVFCMDTHIKHEIPPRSEVILSSGQLRKLGRHI